MPERPCLYLYVSKEFSNTPGPRYRTEGPFSGEQFYQEHLLPRFRLALDKKALLFIDLDDTAGYATSFLEEAFGNLSLEFGVDTVLNNIQLKSDDEAYLTDEIRKYIRETKTK